MNAEYKSLEKAEHNFLDEFASEVSIHLLLVVQFWHSTFQTFFMVDSFFRWKLANRLKLAVSYY